MTGQPGYVLKMLRSLELHDFLYEESGNFIDNDLKYSANPIRAESDEWDILTCDDVPEPNPMFGVVVGELIHDVRSALDHLIYELVSENDEDPGEHTQFPIYGTEKEWVRAFSIATPSGPRPRSVASTRTRSASSARSSRTTSRRTSSDSGTRLMQLLRMSNVDKHRTLHTTAFNAGAPQYVRYEPAGYMAILKKQFKKPGSVVKKDTEIGRVKRRVIQTPPPDTQVKLRIRGNIDLMFSEPGKEPITGLRGVGLIMWMARGIISPCGQGPEIPFPSRPRQPAFVDDILKRSAARSSTCGSGGAGVGGTA